MDRAGWSRPRPLTSLARSGLHVPDQVREEPQEVPFHFVVVGLEFLHRTRQRVGTPDAHGQAVQRPADPRDFQVAVQPVVPDHVPDHPRQDRRHVAPVSAEGSVGPLDERGKRLVREVGPVPGQVMVVADIDDDPGETAAGGTDERLALADHVVAVGKAVNGHVAPHAPHDSAVVRLPVHGPPDEIRHQVSHAGLRRVFGEIQMGKVVHGS